MGLLFVVQIELFRARGVQGRHFRSNLIKRKVWGSFFSPQIAKMCSLGPKKAPPDLTFHKGFAKLATLTEKCSPGDQFGLTIVDPNQFSKKRKIYQKFNQNGAYIAAPNQFSRKNIFSQKVFRFGSYIVMPNQWNLFCKKITIFFSISKANRSSILIFHFKFILKFDFSIWNSYFPSKLIFFGVIFFLLKNQYGASIFLRKMIFYFAILQKTENQYGSAICFPNWCFFAKGATWLRTLRKHYET